MAAHGKRDEQPWYRSTAAIFTAGGVAAAVLAGLVSTIVLFSGDWTNPAPTVLTTTVSPPTAPSSQTGGEPLIITPTQTSETFTTSVSVSTTDIGMPTEESTTTSGTSETSGTTTGTDTSTAAGSSTTGSSDDQGEPTTTRKRPRLNETRSYSPNYSP